MNRVFTSDGRQAYWGGLGIVIGAAVMSRQHSWRVGMGVALVAIPFVVFLRCIFRRFSKVELSETHLTGPWRHSIFLRRAILREKIYRARSGKRSFLAKWYGYWDLFTDTGECVRVPCALLGPEQTEALMSELGFVSDEAKWARWRNDFAWFVLAAWTVFAYLITKPSP